MSQYTFSRKGIELSLQQIVKDNPGKDLIIVESKMENYVIMSNGFANFILTIKNLKDEGCVLAMTSQLTTFSVFTLHESNRKMRNRIKRITFINKLRKFRDEYHELLDSNIKFRVRY